MTDQREKCPACGTELTVTGRRWPQHNLRTGAPCPMGNRLQPHAPDADGRFHVQPYAQQRQHSPRRHPRGICPTCKYDWTMTKDGLLRDHRWGAEQCPGVGGKSLGLPDAPAPQHAHQWQTAASWPSGPDGETDTMDVCAVPDCGAVSLGQADDGH